MPTNFSRRPWHYTDATSVLKHAGRDFARVFRTDSPHSLRIKDADILMRSLNSEQSLQYAEVRLRRMLELDPEDPAPLRTLLNRVENKLARAERRPKAGINANA